MPLIPSHITIEHVFKGDPASERTLGLILAALTALKADVTTMKAEVAIIKERTANMPTPAQLEALIAQLDPLTSAVQAMEQAFTLQAQAVADLRAELAADLAESDLNAEDQAKTLAAIDRFAALNQRIFTAATNNTPATPPPPPVEPPAEEPQPA